MWAAASFFSGIGGLDLAFAWAGFNITFQCEIDPYCQQVLKKWKSTYWPNARLMEDIRNVKAADVGPVDVMFGGFPCQDISVAGNQAGIKVGNRSGLWFEFARLISDIRPRLVLLENVSAILTTGGDTVIESLAQIGYDAQWQTLRASDIGAPHQRERWFCVAYPQSTHDRRVGRTMAKTPRHARKQNDGRKFDCNGQNCRAKLAVTCRQRCGSRRNHRGGRYLLRNRRLATQDKPQRHRWQRGSGAVGQDVARRKRPTQSECSTQPGLGRGFDGFSGRMDRRNRISRTDYHAQRWSAYRNEPQYPYEPGRVTDIEENRVDRVKALGNAVVPQQAYPFVLAMREFLQVTS